MSQLLGAISASVASTERRRAPCASVLLAFVAWFCLPACISTNQPSPDDNALRIGTVLPFSGVRAASGVPLEAALRLAVDDVNAAGGLAGRRLWLDVADSHSDDVRGTANAVKLIENNQIPFFVGTEEPKIAYQITDLVKAHGMVHLMPGLTAAQFHDPSASAAWFRLSPSVAFVSCALAKRVLADGLSKVSVVVDADDYSGTFAVRFGSIMRNSAKTPMPTLLLDPNSASYADIFARLMTLAPEAIVLMTSPTIAAKFLQEWAVRGRPVKVYLGPTLNDPALLRNVPVGVLEGLVGVSADLGEQAPRFASYLQERTTVLPIASAHTYFDAVALLSLAVAEGFAQEDAIPTPAAMRQHMLNVSSAGGAPVTFDHLADGLALLAAGQKVSYSGAAGSYVLSVQGDSTLTRGSIWQIAGSEFVTVGFEQCAQSEIDTTSRL
jgi:ABC-type branched-subunit amino acid transport system substrate-binding protein